jgi:hypothetical protein
VCYATVYVCHSLHCVSFHVLVQLALYVLRRLKERREVQDEVTKEMILVEFQRDFLLLLKQMLL